MSDTLTNTAKASYKYLSQDLSETATSTFEILPKPVKFTKSQTPTSGLIGTLVDFTLTLFTSAAIQNVNIIDDLLTAGYTFVVNSVKIDGISQPGSNPSTGISLGNLAPNTTKTVTFQGTVN